MEKDKKRPTPHELAQRIILRHREKLKKLGLITRREDMPQEILDLTDDDETALGIDLSQFSSSSVKQLHLQVIMCSVSNALSDGAWKFFGYSSRPKYGSIFQLFRPKWKVDIETKLIRELIITYIAAHVVAGIVSIEDVKQVIDVFVDYQYKHDLVSLGYTSQKEAKTAMQTSIQKYAKTPVDSWDKVFMSHICLASLPKNKTTIGIVAGCVKFSQLSNFIIHQLKNQ